MELTAKFTPWRDLGTLPGKSFNHLTSTVVGNKIFRVCANPENNRTVDLWCYEISSATWSKEPSIETPNDVAKAHLVSVDQKLYLFCKHGLYNKSARSYDTEQKIWSDCSDLRTNNSQSYTTVIGNKILVWHRELSGMFDIYDPSTDTWAHPYQTPFQNLTGYQSIIDLGDKVISFEGHRSYSGELTAFIFTYDEDGKLQLEEEVRSTNRMFSYRPAFCCQVGNEIYITGVTEVNGSITFVNGVTNVFDTLTNTFFQDQGPATYPEGQDLHSVDGMVYILNYSYSINGEDKLFTVNATGEPVTGNKMYVTLEVHDTDLLSAARQKPDIITAPTHPAGSLLL